MLSDFHNDFLTEASSPLTDIAIKASCMVCAIFRGNRTYGQICRLFDRFHKERCANQFLGLEDIGYVAKYGFGRLLRENPVCASLTWNGENELAGGCMQDCGMKPEGMAAVKKLTEKGVFIDCAHLGKSAFRTLLDLTDKIVNTHTCAAAVYPHPRNLEDWQIREIADRGGLVGMTFVGKFLSHDPAIKDIFMHTDHCVQKFGISSLCFGTDFFGTDDLPVGLSGYDGNGFDELYTLFLKAGYRPTEIYRIFVGNLQDFLYCKHT